MTTVWKDPKKYRDYNRLHPLVELAKSIVVGLDGYPIDIEKNKRSVERILSEKK